MEPKEQVMESRLLGILRQSPQSSLTELSKQLHLPKAELVRQLEQLRKEEALTIEADRFVLTPRGEKQAILPEEWASMICACEYAGLTASEGESDDFDWMAVDYLPTWDSFA